MHTRPGPRPSALTVAVRCAVAGRRTQIYLAAELDVKDKLAEAEPVYARGLALLDQYQRQFTQSGEVGPDGISARSRQRNRAGWRERQSLSCCAGKVIHRPVLEHRIRVRWALEHLLLRNGAVLNGGLPVHSFFLKLRRDKEALDLLQRARAFAEESLGERASERASEQAGLDSHACVPSKVPNTPSSVRHRAAAARPADAAAMPPRWLRSNPEHAGRCALAYRRLQHRSGAVPHIAAHPHVSAGRPPRPAPRRARASLMAAARRSESLGSQHWYCEQVAQNLRRIRR
jgi:hypothetical protein